MTPMVKLRRLRKERAKKLGRYSSLRAAATMRSRVGFGMCRADGASLRTADTVPADKPTCAATAFRVTRPFCAAAFLTLVIVLALAKRDPTRSYGFLRGHYRLWQV